MDKQEEIEKAYHSKRKVYEEQEIELINQRNKAVSILEEVQARSHFYLKSIIPDTEMLSHGLQQVEYMKEEVVESTSINLKELTEKMDTLEGNTYRQLRKLEDENK